MAAEADARADAVAEAAAAGGLPAAGAPDGGESPRPDDSPPLSSSSWRSTRALCEPIELRKVRYADGSFDPEKPMHEDWLELFTDLLFVSFYMKASGSMGQAGWGGGRSIVFCFIVFWNFYFGNLHMTAWINNYACGGLMRLVLLAMVPLGMCVSQLHMDADHMSECSLGYIIGFVITRTGLSTLSALAWFHNQDVGKGPLSLACGSLCAIVIVLVGWCISSEPWALAAAQVLAALVEATSRMLFLPCSPLWGAPQRFPGINIGHLQARNSIALMVALGECIIQILTLEYQDPHERWRDGITGGGFCLAFNIALVYFDAQPHDIADHALRKSWRRAIVHRFVFPIFVFHVFLIGFLFEVIILAAEAERGHHEAPHLDEWLFRQAAAEGLGFEDVPMRRLQGHHLSEEWTLDLGRLLFSYAVGTAHVLLTWSRFIHAGCDGLQTPRDRWRLTWHLLLGGCHLAVAALCHTVLPLEAPDRALLEVWIHYLLTVPLVLSTLRRQPHGHHSGHHDHDSHEASAALALEPGASFAAARPLQPSEAEAAAAVAAAAAEEDFVCDPFVCKVEGGVSTLPQCNLALRLGAERARRRRPGSPAPGSFEPPRSPGTEACTAGRAALSKAAPATRTF